MAGQAHILNRLHLSRPARTTATTDARVLPTDRRWFKTTTTGTVITTTDTFGATGAASIAGSVLTKATDADGAWNNYASAAGAGGTAGLRFHTSSADWTQPQLDPTLVWTVKTAAAITDMRLWIGYSIGSGAAAMANSASPFDDTIAFRYDTTVPDANWQAVTRRTANTVTDTGVVVAINTVYQLEWTASATSVIFRINEAVVATHTTNLPTASSDMFGEMVLFNVGANPSRAIKWVQTTGISD